MLDYIRIGCAVPGVRVADTKKNAQDICAYIRRAEAEGCDVVVFPELALTGYSCADLFFQETLLRGSLEGLRRIRACSGQCPGVTAVVGLPLMLDGQLYNCGAVVSRGVVRGFVPKTYLPNYGEFYEQRWFSSAEDLPHTRVKGEDLGLPEEEIPVGRDLLFRVGDGVLLGVEICEDLWTPMPPSTLIALNGAEVIVNLSASNEYAGKRSFRRELVRHQSSACGCVYAFCSAGCTESTQDTVFSGHSMVAENGRLLAENREVIAGDYLLTADADLGKIRAVRCRNKSVREAVSFYRAVEPMRTVAGPNDPLRSDGSLYPLEPYPFVPADPQQRQAECEGVFAIQAAGLARRLELLNAVPVVGVSGGLDSALALLVAVEAMHRLGRPAGDVHGLTLPCFGTTGRTRNNALELMDKLGITVREISIREAVRQHFADIGHDHAKTDAVYENAQARERTQVLMDYAGMVGGIVVGTGDLSELALGWCTYNADQMSMYSVNGSVPKTMIPHVLEAVCRRPEYAGCARVVADIIDTPISPELLPPDSKGVIAQQTEDLVGPYALHDFFLYHMLTFGFAPDKLYTLACRAFDGQYAPETVKKWLKVFLRRFFSQQFKRGCMPDGVKATSVSLNPRADWRMPSDAASTLWLDMAERL